MVPAGLFVNSDRESPQWADLSGVPYKRLWARVNTLKWSFERAITEGRWASERK